MLLRQPEIHLDTGHHRDRLAVLLARPEAPLGNSFNRLLVQPRIERTGNAYCLRLSVLVDHDTQ